MSTWLYQISPIEWSPERYRAEIWEGEKWAWPVRTKTSGGRTPQTGDIIVFFCSPTGGKDPGFYGWSVVLEWVQESSSQLHFRPTAPSDYLKMHPWWSAEAKALADDIRGTVKQKTLWLVNDKNARTIRRGVTTWLSRRAGRSEEK